MYLDALVARLTAAGAKPVPAATPCLHTDREGLPLLIEGAR
jgi:hypothetical protein